MKRAAVLLIMLSFLLLTNLKILSQGITRSHGIGLRAGFWNITNHPTRINVVGYGKDGTIDIGGTGGWLYFFSRLQQNWFLEFNFGAIAGIHQSYSDYSVNSVEATAVVPLLLGLRYDVLSPKMPSSLQPYLSLGGGPYWISKAVTNNKLAIPDETVIESGQKAGMYLGTGANLVITNWLGLNFDMKYHFVEMKFEKGYSGLEFELGFCLMWGKKRETFHIKEIRLIVKDIYPAYYQFYNSYPLALITIKNDATYPIEVKVRSYVRPYSERPKDSEYIRIERGKVADIPVTAVFGKNLLSLSRREPAVLDMEIEARAGSIISKTISESIMLHDRNAWDGEMDKLSLFITADDEEILHLSRSIIADEKQKRQSELNNFEQAKLLFDELTRQGIHYQNDPNIIFYKDDRVQYASETLRLKYGDCDDLVILFASLLESTGINTAFVEVKDPEKEVAHLYLLFDTEMPSTLAENISANEKRYLVREQANNTKTIWIPVETTLVEKGFDKAWEMGATNYLKDGIFRHGISAGWVRIIDIE